MVRAGKTEIVGKDITVEEVMDEVSGDRVYYARSGGGITLSGGECMAQPDFAEALLRACHEYGFNTAIETTAYASREVVDRLLPHIDHFLMDIKHMDSVKHEAFTGRPNGKILENARYIAENASQLIICFGIRESAASMPIPKITTFPASVCVKSSACGGKGCLWSLCPSSTTRTVRPFMRTPSSMPF